MKARAFPVFGVVLTIMLLFDSVKLAIALTYSGDARAWWPLVIGFLVVLSVVYSRLFSWLCRGRESLSMRAIVGYNVGFGVVTCLYAVIFHRAGGWGREGGAEVNPLVFLAPVIRHDAAIYALYLASLTTFYLSSVRPFSRR